MRVVLIGAPGSGKGTQALRLAGHYGATHLAAGDRLRAEVASGNELGRRLAGYLSRGDLVPDDLVIELMWRPIVEAAATGGYVLDGFPRTLAQAEAAYAMGTQAGVTAHAAVYLEGDAQALVGRMLRRAGTGGRTDDVESVIRHRLEVFELLTAPLVEHYAGRGMLVRVDAMAEVDAVTAAIEAALEPLRPAAD